MVNVAEEEIWVDIREDSNFIIVNMATKCSHSGVEEKIQVNWGEDSNLIVRNIGNWSVDVLYSAAYTFIDICRAIPATKLLATSSYKLGVYRYGGGSRTFRNITADSI